MMTSTMETVPLFLKEIVSFFMALFLNQKISFLHVFLENNKDSFTYLEIHNFAHLAILTLRHLLTLSNLQSFIQQKKKKKLQYLTNFPSHLLAFILNSSTSLYIFQVTVPF